MNQKLRKLINQNRFDVIHADQLWMAPYALEAQMEAIKIGYHPKIILDQHNAVYLVPKRMAEATKNFILKPWLKREAALMANFEKRTCLQFDQVVWVSKDDFQAINSISFRPTKGNSATTSNKMQSWNNSIIPICINASEITPFDSISKTNEILFIGGMHWPPNADGVTWFGKEVLPLIYTENPLIQFIVVGRQPPESIKNMDQIRVTGYVGDPDGYWSHARVFVVPLRAAGGMRVKILESWAKGIPIVSTTVGAEGIKYQPGKDILIADTAMDFANAVSKILRDDDLAQSLSHNGRRTLEKFYDWQKIYPAWDLVYKRINEGAVHNQIIKRTK
jgi:glycosyltransferase involved in cell wall biosynthesis